MKIKEEDFNLSYMVNPLKTRDLLVEVARTLFASKGYANTTMNDIANASNKGRRTLYSYFKSKDEMFYAVIQQETNKLRERLKVKAADTSKKPLERLVDYIYYRMEQVKEIVIHNGGLDAEFFQNQNLVERVRHRLDFNERIYLRKMLEDGKDNGEFTITNPEFGALILQSALKGMELPFIRGELAIAMLTNKENLCQFVGFGLMHRS